MENHRVRQAWVFVLRASGSVGYDLVYRSRSLSISSRSLQVEAWKALRFTSLLPVISGGCASAYISWLEPTVRKIYTMVGAMNFFV